MRNSDLKVLMQRIQSSSKFLLMKKMNTPKSKMKRVRSMILQLRLSTKRIMIRRLICSMTLKKKKKKRKRSRETILPLS